MVNDELCLAYKGVTLSVCIAMKAYTTVEVSWLHFHFSLYQLAFQSRVHSAANRVVSCKLPQLT